jgi:hypothetical protein
MSPGKQHNKTDQLKTCQLSFQEKQESRSKSAHLKDDVVCEDYLLIRLYNLRLCIIHDERHLKRVTREEGRGWARGWPLSLISVFHTEWLNFETNDPRQMRNLVRVDEDCELQMVVQVHLCLRCIFLKYSSAWLHHGAGHATVHEKYDEERTSECMLLPTGKPLS